MVPEFASGIKGHVRQEEFWVALGRHMWRRLEAPDSVPPLIFAGGSGLELIDFHH